MVSVVVSFCAVLFPTNVLDEILNLIESVSEDFPSYSTWLTNGNHMGPVPDLAKVSHAQPTFE